VEGWDPERVQWFLASAANVSTKSWPRPYGKHLREGKLDRANLSHPDLLKVWRLLPGVVSDDAETRERSAASMGRLEVVVTDTDAAIEIRAPWRIPMSQKSGVVVLDATGQLTIAELKAANPRTTVRQFALNVRPDPELRLSCVQIETKSVSRRRLIKSGAVTPRALGTLRNALREVDRLAQQHLGPGKHPCALLTFKAIADFLVRHPVVCRMVVPPGLEISAESIGYYGKDERGSNRFVGVRALITVGDPVPNIGAAEADGRALEVPAQDLIDGRTGAALVQAHGRARSLRAQGAVLHVHVGRVRPPDWTDCKVIGLSPGRLPSDVRERVWSVVEFLLNFRDIAAVPLVGALVSGTARPEEGLFRTAYESLIGSFAKTPPVLAATLHRWIGEEAGRRGAAKTSVGMPDSTWTVWHMPSLPATEVQVRARRWWRLLHSSELAAEGEEVEWSA